MGVFANNAITDVGRMLLADVQAGAVFTPTRIVIGSGTMPAGATTQAMTAVITPVKSLAINKKKRTPDGKCIFGGVYTNAEVTEPFYFRELALYAKAVYINEDGTVKSEGAETLYSYGNAGATADYMAAYSASTVVERQMDLVTWVGNDAKVDLTIESGVYVVQEAFESHASRHAIGGEDPITPKDIGAAPADVVIGANLSEIGWYKIGTLFNKSFSGACATFHIRGQYYHYWPATAMVDVVCAFDSAFAKTRLQTGNLEYQISKLGLVKEGNDTYGVYVYYAYASTNVVEITVVTQPDTFVSANFEATDVSENNMATVAYLNEYENPAFVAGVEYRTTERRNGKAVYKKLDSDGVLRYRLDGETGWKTYAQENGAAPAGYVTKLYSVVSDADIDKAMLDFYNLTADNSIGYFILSVDIEGLMLPGGAWHLTVYRSNSLYGSIDLTSYETNTIRKATRGFYGGAFYPVAWINPPLLTGIEYRTIDRYKGAAVYKKVNANGDILWRVEGETSWHLLSSASYVSAASVE